MKSTNFKQSLLVKYKTNRNHFNKCARKFQICSLRNYYTNFVWRNDATNSQLIWRKATASSEYSVNFGLEIDSFGLYCPFYFICTAFWNVSKSPWNSIFFLWFHIDVTCATASSAKINLLVLFKQNTYFGSRSQTRWWNGVSLISNSSDSFTNSVPMNLRIFSTIRINNQTHSRFAATENSWKNLMNSI